MKFSSAVVLRTASSLSEIIIAYMQHSIHKILMGPPVRIKARLRTCVPDSLRHRDSSSERTPHMERAGLGSHDRLVEPQIWDILPALVRVPMPRRASA